MRHQGCKLLHYDDADAYFVGFVLLLSLLGYVVVLQHHIFLCHIAEPGGFGAERTDIEGKFLRTVIFPCIYQNAEHSAEVVELSVEDFVAEFYFIFIFIHCQSVLRKPYFRNTII